MGSARSDPLALPSARFSAAATGWPGRDSGKSAHRPQPPTAQRGAVFLSVVRALRVVGSGRPGFWPLLSRLGAAALFLNPGTRLSGHRRQPRRRGSLADWGLTPSKALQMQKYENVKEVVETIRQFFSRGREDCVEGEGEEGRRPCQLQVSAPLLHPVLSPGD